MADRNGPTSNGPSPRDIAVNNAADAANAYQAAPDTYTLHRMQSAVQTAQLLGASLTDIRAARGQQ
jgi:hypothetical protein